MNPVEIALGHKIGELMVANAKLSQAIEMLKAELAKRDEIIKKMKEPALPLSKDAAANGSATNGADHDSVA